MLSGCLSTKPPHEIISEADNLRGKNLFCEEHNAFVTYSFFDNERFQTNYYFLVFLEIGIRSGNYGVLNNARYFYLKANKKLEILSLSDKSKNEKNWESKIYQTPKLDYYLDRENLSIVFSPIDYSEIKHKCKIFDGTAEELKESTLKKYLKHFEEEENKKIYEQIREIDQQRKKNKI